MDGGDSSRPEDDDRDGAERPFWPDRGLRWGKQRRHHFPGEDLGFPIAGPGSLATFGTRFVGLIIDGLLLGVVGFVLRVTITAIGPTSEQVAATTDGTVVVTRTTVAGNLLLAVPYAIYVVVLIGAFGCTIGQRSQQLTVVKTDGRPADWGTAVRRWAPFGLWAVIGILTGSSELAGLGELAVLASMFVDRDRRGLHDKLAGAVVIRSEAALDHDRNW